MKQEHIEILLAEANPSDIELALHAFKANSLADHVHVVRDGAEALEFIFCSGRYAGRNIAVPPKIILLDIKLPLVDGIEVLRRIKRDRRTRMIPVVAMTASKEACNILKSYQLGISSYLVKPIDFDRFTKAVQHLGYYWLLLNQRPTCSL